MTPRVTTEERQRVEKAADSVAVEPESADRSDTVLLALGFDRQQARAALAGLPTES